MLFSGTGCQINGLLGYLGKDYDNLFCVDVICHGVPSQKLWKAHVESLEEKHGKLKAVDFRRKEGLFKHRIGNNMYIPKDKDPFMNIFLGDYALRPSCYECKVKTRKRSDMTIGDFWGLDSILPSFSDGKGVSIVILRSNKAKIYFEKIENSLIVQEVQYSDGVRFNPMEYSSISRPNARDMFYSDMDRLTYDKCFRKYAMDIRSVMSRFYNALSIILMQNILGKSYYRMDEEYGMYYSFEKKRKGS